MKKNDLVFNNAVIGNNFDSQESNTITFSIDGEETIKLNKDGFYIKGNLVEDDKEIYHQFKKWIDSTLKKERNE